MVTKPFKTAIHQRIVSHFSHEKRTHGETRAAESGHKKGATLRPPLSFILYRVRELESYADTGREGKAVIVGSGHLRRASVFGIVVPKRIVPTDAFTKRTAHCQDHDGFFVTVKWLTGRFSFGARIGEAELIRAHPGANTQLKRIDLLE